MNDDNDEGNLRVLITCYTEPYFTQTVNWNDLSFPFNPLLHKLFLLIRFQFMFVCSSNMCKCNINRKI